MNVPVIIGLAVVLFAVVVYLSGYQHLRWAHQTRDRHFKTICEAWLKRINTVADDFPNKIIGSPFYRLADKKLKVKVSGSSWWVGYPIHKMYPNMGFQVDAILVVYVYSLTPNKDGAIETVFADLTKPVGKWWDSSHRCTIFPIISTHLHAHGGKEMAFIFPPAPGSVLAPKEVSP